MNDRNSFSQAPACGAPIRTRLPASSVLAEGRGKGDGARGARWAVSACGQAGYSPMNAPALMSEKL
eukprot:6140687-Pyramimonas_sp.AAC.1